MSDVLIKKITFYIGKIKSIHIVVALFFIVYFLPFILFGEDCIITIHDNLDSTVPLYKMFHDIGFFLKFDFPTRVYDEMSSLYFGFNFSFITILYAVFPVFVAYCLQYFFSVLIGFFSMCFLLKKILPKYTTMIILISVLYAILPVVPAMSIAVSTLPLIMLLYFEFLAKEVFSPKVLALIFFPIFSSFVLIGIFILVFWVFGIVFDIITNKRINLNLVFGFLVLCIGYILVDLKLFYIVFFIKEPLNRSIFNMWPHGIKNMVKIFLSNTISIVKDGFYHAASMQKMIILPFTFLVSICLFIVNFFKIEGDNNQTGKRIKIDLYHSTEKIKLLFVMEFAILILAMISGLYESGLLNGLIINFVPVLFGFAWGRVWIFNRILWYITFALIIYYILQPKSIAITFTKNKKQFIISSKKIKLFAYLIIIFQFVYVLVSQVEYNDISKTWLNKIILKMNITEKIYPKNSSPISYREYFAQDLFNEIKYDISYSNEKVAALGYHPSVLLYNGFNCIDGYNSAYPLSYMKKFRTLIAPELDQDNGNWFKEYFDSWGGRAYLFNTELNYEPTKDKNTSPVILNIDMDVFKNDFKGKYIISRAAVANCDTLGLKLIKKYDNEKSIYTIYLYTVI